MRNSKRSSNLLKGNVALESIKAKMAKRDAEQGHPRCKFWTEEVQIWVEGKVNPLPIMISRADLCIALLDGELKRAERKPSSEKSPEKGKKLSRKESISAKKKAEAHEKWAAAKAAKKTRRERAINKLRWMQRKADKEMSARTTSLIKGYKKAAKLMVASEIKEARRLSLQAATIAAAERREAARLARRGIKQPTDAVEVAVEKTAAPTATPGIIPTGAIHKMAGWKYSSHEKLAPRNGKQGIWNEDYFQIALERSERLW